MICNKYIAKKTAKQSLQAKAVNIQPEKPFTWASGWQSPIYCDNRVLLSYPEIRREIVKAFCTIIKDEFPDVQVIAGVATGAIAIGVLVAEQLGLPFVYVRPKPKEHGQKNQLEGRLEAHQKVVVIEDLVSTGMSSMNAINALKNEPITIAGMVAIFTYGFDVSESLFKEENIKLITLSDYYHLLGQAVDEQLISQAHLENLQQWRLDPAHWNPNL